MEILDIYFNKEGDVIIMKIAPKWNKSNVHTILLDNHVDNRELMRQFKHIEYMDLKAKHGSPHNLDFLFNDNI